MPTNDFKAFATSGGATVLSQAAYVALTSLLQNGFQVGTAIPEEVNKVLRQSTAMASAIGTMVVGTGGYDALDDGNISALRTAIENTIAAIATNIINSNKRVGQVIVMAGSATPSGTLSCNGSGVSTATYSALTTFAYSSGMLASSSEDKVSNPGKFWIDSGLLYLPDLRTHFLSFAGGPYSLGVYLSDAFASHGHDYLGTTSSDGNHAHFNGMANTVKTPFVYGGSTSGIPGLATQQMEESNGPMIYQGITSTEGAHSHTYSGTTSNSGSSETRSRTTPLSAFIVY